jgi:hypothetical protein
MLAAVRWVDRSHSHGFLDSTPDQPPIHGITSQEARRARCIVVAAAHLATLLLSGLPFRRPQLRLFFGWHFLFEEKIYAIWVLDFVLAFVFGIGFDVAAAAKIEPENEKQPKKRTHRPYKRHDGHARPVAKYIHQDHPRACDGGE